ncbi:MAG: hypothetical protein CM1200mP2_45020 [Planctomycetaceae bacterium]|nr:MAG: hypothetical protein CM1200mP2_45020 [Planctomycetaceae bacterium]
MINQSTEWLGKRPTRQRRSPDALGILWEQVRAQEALAVQRTTVEKDRNQFVDRGAGQLSIHPAVAQQIQGRGAV